VKTRDELTSLRLVAHPDLMATQPAEPTTGPRNNAQGFTVGERWTFNRIDRWKGSVVGELVQRVERIEDDGRLVLSSDAEYTPSWTRLVRDLLNTASPGLPPKPDAAWWSDMKPGDERRLRYTAQQRRDDGVVVPADVEARLVHKGLEPIKVPAGEFQAVRLDADALSNWTTRNMTAASRRWTLSVWYVPALRSIVASEVTSSIDRERLELTAFDLRSGPLASR